LALIPPFEFDLNIAKKVMPLTIIYLCMVVFNNLCLQYVQVSFYQVARSLTVLWTALFTKLILGKSVSYFRMLAVCVVFIGFVIGSKGEKLFDWGGLIFGVVASIFVALYGIYVKRVLPAVNDNEWRLLIYNTLLALVLLMPIVVIAGEGIVLDPRATDIEVTAFTWAAIFASGLVGFLINIAIFMQIKYTSPLTNAISGTVKAAVQTLLGVVLFGNIISAMNFIGIVVVIGGSFWYGQISYRENEAEKRARLAK
jgi:solute carrier family 35 (GDP-fucose transporter), member C1